MKSLRRLWFRWQWRFVGWFVCLIPQNIANWVTQHFADIDDERNDEPPWFD